MPDDVLGTGTEDSKASDDKVAAKDTGLTEEALKTAMESSFGGLFKDISGGLGTMADNMGTISQRLGNLEAGKQQEQQALQQQQEELDPDAPGRELLADPQTVMRKAALQATADATGPLFESLINTNKENALRQIAGEIDQKYGEGVWQEVFADKVNAVVDGYPPQFKGKSEYIRSAVDTILGQAFDVLTDKRSDFKKSQQAAEEAQTTSPGNYSPLGPGRQGPEPAKLSPEEKDFVQRFAKSVDPSYTEERYLKAKTLGNTEEEWTQEVTHPERFKSNKSKGAA